MTKDGNSDRLLSSSPNTDGGPGSGNFGHAGRPGEVGGSAETHCAIETYPKPTLKYSSKEEYLSAQRDAYDHYVKKVTRIDNDRKKNKEEYKLSKRASELKKETIESDSSLGEFDKNVALAQLKADEIEAENRFVLAASKSELDTLSAIDEYNSSYDPYYEFTAINGSHSIENDSSVDVINPNNLDMNCQRCAVALEYRRRGYNVSASDGEDDELADGRLISACFQHADKNSYDYNDIELSSILVKRKMEEYGDGSRAILLAMNEYGQGHAINVEMCGGKLFAIDSQNGIVEPYDGIFDTNGNTAINLSFASSVTLIRTDNAVASLVSRKYVKER